MTASISTTRIVHSTESFTTNKIRITAPSFQDSDRIFSGDSYFDQSEYATSYIDGFSIVSISGTPSNWKASLVALYEHGISPAFLTEWHGIIDALGGEHAAGVKLTNDAAAALATYNYPHSTNCPEAKFIKLAEGDGLEESGPRKAWRQVQWYWEVHWVGVTQHVILLDEGVVSEIAAILTRRAVPLQKERIELPKTMVMVYRE